MPDIAVTKKKQQKQKNAKTVLGKGDYPDQGR